MRRRRGVVGGDKKHLKSVHETCFKRGHSVLSDICVVF